MWHQRQELPLRPCAVLAAKHGQRCRKQGKLAPAGRRAAHLKHQDLKAPDAQDAGNVAQDLPPGRQQCRHPQGRPRLLGFDVCACRWGRPCCQGTLCRATAAAAAASAAAAAASQVLCVHAGVVVQVARVHSQLVNKQRGGQGDGGHCMEGKPPALHPQQLGAADIGGVKGACHATQGGGQAHHAKGAPASLWRVVVCYHAAHCGDDERQAHAVHCRSGQRVRWGLSYGWQQAILR